MKKTLALVLAVLMLLATLTTALTLIVNATESNADTLPTPTFTYDFAKGLTDDVATQQNQMTYENKDGYITFTATDEDPYFRFADGAEPTVTTENLAYAVMKYRTTASVGKGEFFTNRHSGPQWGAQGTHVQWDYRNDGEWHAVVIDTTSAWGATAGDSLYAFRLDPLATPAKVGDTIDIAYIHFFATKEDAHAFALAEFPDDQIEEVTTEASYTIRFNVDGQTVYTLTYTLSGTFKEPVVPARPGYIGQWEAYSLTGGDLTVNAVYTPDEKATVAGEATDADVPAMPTEPAETTASEADATTPAETTAAATGGCVAVMSMAIPAAIAVAACLNLRKKED